jgi:hypothetical protein
MGVLTEQSRIHAPLAMERTTLSTLPPLYSLPERQQSETQVVISAHVGWEGGGGCGLMGVYIRKGADSTLMTERTKGGGGFAYGGILAITVPTALLKNCEA